MAKRGKAVTDRKMIKGCVIALTEEMCPEKVNLFELVESVSLSANTAGYRIEAIAKIASFNCLTQDLE